jgi:hypothetical protein
MQSLPSLQPVLLFESLRLGYASHKAAFLVDSRLTGHKTEEAVTI